MKALILHIESQYYFSDQNLAVRRYLKDSYGGKKKSSRTGRTVSNGLYYL
jgi:hypothetical protein